MKTCRISSRFLGMQFWLLIVSVCLANIATSAETIFSLYKSTDRGTSWFQVGHGLPQNARINALEAMGKNLVAGTDHGIFISQDAGVEWQAVQNSGGATFRVLCLATLGKRIFAGTEKHGVQVSDDDGLSWKPTNNGLGDLYIRSLLAVGKNLYAGTDLQGVFVFEIQHAAWRQQQNGLPAAAQVFDLAEINGTIFAGLYSKGLYRWDAVLGQWSRVGNVVPLEVATAGNTLVVGHNPGGVFVSEDLGNTWQDGNLGLPVNAPVWTLAANQARVWVGTTGKISSSTDPIGLFASEDNGKSWRRSDAGLPLLSAAISILTTKEFMLVGIISPNLAKPPAVKPGSK